MAWTVGTMVNEEVRLARPLGGKSESRVWVADQLDWKRQIVVKFVAYAASVDDPDAVFALLEKIATAQIEHPRMVQMFNQGLTDDGLPYVLLELVAGESLAERVKRGRVPAAETLALLGQLAEVVDEAHQAGLVHTGLDAGSVMLCKSSGGLSVKLLNLGVSALAPRPRTWPPIAPEQYLQRPLVPATDLWALGFMAYEMLTAKQPTTAETRRKLKWEPTPISELWISDLPESLDGWFARALDPKPERRFGSAAELVETLGAALAGGKTAAAKGTGPAAPRPTAAAAGKAAPVAPGKVIGVGGPAKPGKAKADPKPPPDDEPVKIDVDD